MDKDTKGYIKMDDRDYWTLVEMINKFKDENHTVHKKKSLKPNRLKPYFRK